MTDYVRHNVIHIWSKSNKNLPLQGLCRPTLENLQGNILIWKFHSYSQGVSTILVQQLVRIKVKAPALSLIVLPICPVSKFVLNKHDFKESSI